MLLIILIFETDAVDRGQKDQVSPKQAVHHKTQNKQRVCGEMPREKSPGLKILWLWTIGTAAVLVTTVVRTRMRDMEELMKADRQQPQHQQQQQETILSDSFPVDSNVIREDD